jgi:integrase
MATPRVTLKSKTSARGPRTYYLDYRVNGKRLRPKVGTSRKDAELVRAKVEQELVLGTYQLSATKKSVSLSGLIDEFLAAKENTVRATTQHRYKNYLDPLRAYFNKSFPSVTGDIRLIETKYLRKFIDDSLRGGAGTGRAWSRRTANDAINIIRSLFKFAVESEYLVRNPASKLEMLRIASTGRPDFYTEDELQAIWKNVDSHWVDALKFISLTGLRKAELINLRWENLDFTKGAEQMTIESCDDWETKTGKSRPIPLFGEALEIVERQRGKNPTYVFTSPEGKMVHPDRIYHALKQCLAELHIEGDVHKMRHTFASNLAMSDVPMLQIRDLLGHTDLKTTQIYAHVAPKHLRDAISKLTRSDPGAHPGEDRQGKG